MKPIYRILIPILLCTGFLGMAQTGVNPVPDLGVPSTTGVVVSTSSFASDVGAAILHKGGNAVDAAVATAFALAVTHPAAGNIGGGGFMIVREVSGKAVAFDYREKAPLKSKPDMYLDAQGKIDRKLTNEGYLAPGVPGTVRGLELAHKRYGKLPWKDVVAPAVQLAGDGFVMPRGLANELNRQLGGVMGRYPSSVEAYGKPGGGKWTEGDRIVLKDLAKTLAAIADKGADVFYKGWIADRVAEDMKANGGLITKADLAAYKAKIRTPVTGRYRGYALICMPPPSSGGVGLIEMLNILENFDLKRNGRFAPETLHLMIEAMRRAYLDRARFLGDPDFVRVPVAKLTSKKYAKDLAATINPARASSSVELGKDIVTRAQPGESDETTHFCVIDKDGMAVSNTFTLEGGYGSRVVVKGAGFLLNNEMGDFNKKPGETNVTGDIGTQANLIVPEKRMLSSMTPTIVTRDGKVVLITGSPGGRTIINTVLSIVLGVLEFGMNGREAVDSARMHHQWLPDETTFEEGAIPADVAARLKGMGHNVRMQGRQGDGNSILVDPVSRVAYGINDRRSSDSKASR
ncbi:MAG: gamma-glutamyltransferase [Acidobacteriia bacterium]|nr:gamma-glutamyltransferase [Terriglobia bacterium]